MCTVVANEKTGLDLAYSTRVVKNQSWMVFLDKLLSLCRTQFKFHDPVRIVVRVKDLAIRQLTDTVTLVVEGLR